MLDLPSDGEGLPGGKSGDHCWVHLLDDAVALRTIKTSNQFSPSSHGLKGVSA